LFSNEQEVVVFEGSDVDYDKDTDDCHPNDFEHNFEADPDLVFVSTFDPAILRAGNRIWPEIATEGEREKGSPFWHLLNSIAEREFGENCLADVQERVVGHVDDVEIKSDVRVFYKAERD
jgi:hypothetical protein